MSSHVPHWQNPGTSEMDAAGGVRPGTRRVYSSYRNRMEKHWSERRIDEPTPSEIRQFLVEMQSELVIRRSGRGGVAPPNT